MNDGSTSSASKWEKIGFVEGHGTTNSPQIYSFVDIASFTGKGQYRLKQIDFDGKYEYSNIIEISVNNIPVEFELHQNYPNPFNPTTIISYSSPVSAQLISIKVYDIIGNEIAKLIEERKDPGNYSLEFDASALPSGVYIYKLSVGGYSDSKKMLLIK
ncbi:MAG: T9SS type A sorting domain-containing protein [Melioribacteraceae bacterium]|nr:T9SS type A sorting domain-containing protein [Melioribacteraceae bacterium]MCF8265893.1 T9SS type A sorting domain-containing protein [Melioribacteraceae bacterium]MCF8414341.1 T9SS type A sorting domain-containing protein [Melioribacteraceae bacterium]MCF8432710.1 T9SS type A sorting domain-containing protein [Melioribacteraceae bacterium]